MIRSRRSRWRNGRAAPSEKFVALYEGRLGAGSAEDRRLTRFSHSYIRSNVRAGARPREGTEPSERENGGECLQFTFDEKRVLRARKAMLAEDVVSDVADTFKMLASPTRVRIIHALGEEELCVCDLAQVLGLSVSATSHQLQALRKARIVSHRMDGKLAFYRLQDAFVLALLDDGVVYVTSGGGRR